MEPTTGVLKVAGSGYSRLSAMSRSTTSAPPTTLSSPRNRDTSMCPSAKISTSTRSPTKGHCNHHRIRMVPAECVVDFRLIEASKQFK